MNDVNSPINCTTDAVKDFSNHMRGQMWRVNALLLVSVILTGVMVGIGAYGHRYRHHPLTRFLFLGATTLFLPIISYVVSTISNQGVITLISHSRGEIVTWQCDPINHSSLVLVWTGLVQIIGINTSGIVAGDAREGRNTAPPLVLLVKAIWTSYLAVSVIGQTYEFPSYAVRFSLAPETLIFLFGPFALTFAKLLFKYYALYKAKQSLAHGRNPRLIVGYMDQLQDRSQHAELASEHIPPPLIVMGEDTVLVEKQPNGYSFTQVSSRGDGTRINNNDIVTIDKIWQLDAMLLRSTSHLKDLCFSFALFKLLRCRFAGYTIEESGFTKVRNFLRHVMLDDSDDDRVLGVIAYELSFLHDFYYSSLPISYSKSWLPILSIFISLLSIGYCLFIITVMSISFLPYLRQRDHTSPYLRQRDHTSQILCEVMSCSSQYSGQKQDASGTEKSLGSVYFDFVPLCVVIVLVVLIEVREIASNVCSNWTKVTLICRYVIHDSWQQSPSSTIQKWVGCVLQRRCKLLKHWEDNMYQCSILVLHPRKSPMALLRRLVYLPDQKKKVPRAVKVAVVNALRRFERSRDNGDVTYLCNSLQLQVGDTMLWMVNGTEGIAKTLLVCHIATSILEMRSDPCQPLSDHKIAAIHLSRYCAYLVAYSPELLPDDDEWCKSLYKAVKKDAELSLASIVRVSTPEDEYQQAIELLSAGSRQHEVFKNGVELGKQLVGLTEGEEMKWEVLAGFWSETILYVALSENINGHAEAIARGGELVTLLWALLAYLGIVSRTDDTTTTTDRSTIVTTDGDSVGV